MVNTNGSADIRLINVHKSFGPYDILKGINIEFPPGKLTYIMGPSGTGKSVTIKHILGILKPDQGSIVIDGQDITQMNQKTLLKERVKFGMLFQNVALFDNMTVYENVAFPLREHTTLSEKEIEAKVRASLEHLGMPDGFDKYPNELSGGMKKRVGLARAIIREPKILLYDEPTTGLDPITRQTVDELISHLKKTLQLTSIVISHDIPSGLLLADMICFLDKGKVAFWGTPAEFKKSEVPIIQKFLSAEERTVKAMTS